MTTRMRTRLGMFLLALLSSLATAPPLLAVPPPAADDSARGEPLRCGAGGAAGLGRCLAGGAATRAELGAERSALETRVADQRLLA